MNRSLPISNMNPLCSFHLSGWNSLARRRYARVISLAVALRWSPRVRNAVVVLELVVRRRGGVSGVGEGGVVGVEERGAKGGEDGG